MSNSLNPDQARHIVGTDLNPIRVSNSLNPDQARHIVGPDLGPICLQRLSVNDTSKERVKVGGFRKGELNSFSPTTIVAAQTTERFMGLF